MDSDSFIPAGLLLNGVFQKRRWFFILTVGIGISLSIELILLFIHVGFCDTGDLPANSLGGLLGMLAARVGQG